MNSHSLFLFVICCITIMNGLEYIYELKRPYKLYKKYGEKRLSPNIYFVFPLLMIFLSILDIFIYLITGDFFLIVYYLFMFIVISIINIRENQKRLGLDSLTDKIEGLFFINGYGDTVDYHRGFFKFFTLVACFLFIILDWNECFPHRFLLLRNTIVAMSVLFCLYSGGKKYVPFIRKSKLMQDIDSAFVKEPRIFTVTGILLLLCPLLLFFSRDFCIPCLLLSGLQICRMALREKRRGAPLLKTHWERLVIWKFMAGVFFILWGCVETVIWLIR